jgi:undecaprenyl diphosphate synthase
MLKELISKPKVKISTQKIPRHIAITGSGSKNYAEQNNLSFEETYQLKFDNIKDCIQTAITLNVPIVTIYLLPLNYPNNELFSSLVDSFSEFFTELKGWSFLHENKAKISVLGKWYNLPGRVVEPIKEAVNSTKDYDTFFVNFCLNYDGQEEIVDACKVLARQAVAGKIDPEHINKAMIKDNIYSSYFLPPDLFVKIGATPRTSTLLLWDSPNTKVYHITKTWQTFKKEELLKAIEWWQG